MSDTNRKYRIHKMTEPIEAYLCPVVFESNFVDCQLWAGKQIGFFFKKDESLFGGYWANEAGDCLVIM